MSKFSLLEKGLLALDDFLRDKERVEVKVFRSNPADKVADGVLTEDARKQSIEMMRVNHTGEVCAQALYQGQALFAEDENNKQKLQQAALEEEDHLNWCSTRLAELGGSTSKLDRFWHLGSLGIGALASLFGDKVSLGFLAETEFQVSEHLEKHLQKIAVEDKKSKAILEQMKNDELKHASTALQNGGGDLPWIVKMSMRISAKVMTTVAAKI